MLYSIDTHGQLEPYLSQEWLLTNGIGGFASSTILACNARRYHGLLCAATLPPVGRMMMLNRVGEILLLDGKQEMLELSINQFAPDRFHPRGDQYLHRFELDDIARWTFNIDGVTVIKEVQILWLKNVVGIRYTIQPDRPRSVELHLLPFVSLRDFHAVRRGADPGLRAEPAEQQVTVTGPDVMLVMRCDVGRYVHQPDWWFGHLYAIERERGLDDTEDLFNPGRFVVKADAATTITLWASLESIELPDWESERQRRKDAVAAASRSPENVQPTHPAPIQGIPHTPTIHRLLRAANDFIVYRKTPEGQDGTSVLAGYPWFADWGRDTFISLPGLLLTTGRLEQARQVLTVFAHYVSEGMIPNRFDDYTNEPHYNTVDASLWFIHAAFQYLKLSADAHTFDEILLPACRSIFDGYRKGTRFGIQMDETDGLITQGDETTQLTWMDAKYDGTVFTPRQGKAVEINALWYNALILLEQHELALKAAENFRKLFWISPWRGLADVVTNGRKDTSIRPNQIFAVSLPHSPLTDDQQFAVVEVVRRELLTPVGLRTLSRDNPRYQGRFTGSPKQRDGAYHNGTVWPWLIGAFLEAYLKVNQRSPGSIVQARQWLSPLIDQLNHWCIGQINEVYDGDEERRGGGCPAQAWSVAEVLRLAVELQM